MFSFLLFGLSLSLSGCGSVVGSTNYIPASDGTSTKAFVVAESCNTDIKSWLWDDKTKSYTPVIIKVDKGDKIFKH